MNKIARRTLLTAVSLAGAGALGYGGSLAACTARGQRQALLEPLFPAVRDLPDPVRVGRAWLREEDGEQIIARLLETPALVSAALQPDIREQRQMLKAAIRDDFASRSLGDSPHRGAHRRGLGAVRLTTRLG